MKNYNRDNYESSLIYRGEKSHHRGLNLKDEVTRDSFEISVKEIVDFIKNPVRFYYNRGESIYFQDDKDISGDIFENMELDQLYLWKFGSLILDAPVDDLDSIIDRFLYIAGQEGFIKNSTLTKDKKDELFTRIKAIKGSFQELNLEDKGFRKSPRELGGEFPPLKIEVDNIDITITGEMESLWSNGNEALLSSLTLGSKKKLSLRDKIQSYVYSLILFNSGEMEEEILRGYCFGENSIEPVEYRKSGEFKEGLESLLRLILKNFQEPKPFLPQIMEKAGEETPAEELKGLWDELTSESSRVFGLKDCPYIGFTYDKTPEFNMEDFKEFYSHIYRGIKGE